jgi:peptide/nickel transport system permease protein
LGRTAVEAISHKDIPLVEGAILLLSLGYVLVNSLVDATYVLIDPRMRLGSRKGLL